MRECWVYALVPYPTECVMTNLAAASPGHFDGWQLCIRCKRCCTTVRDERAEGHRAVAIMIIAAATRAP